MSKETEKGDNQDQYELCASKIFFIKYSFLALLIFTFLTLRLCQDVISLLLHQSQMRKYIECLWSHLDLGLVSSKSHIVDLDALICKLTSHLKSPSSYCIVNPLHLSGSGQGFSFSDVWLSQLKEKMWIKLFFSELWWLEGLWYLVLGTARRKRLLWSAMWQIWNLLLRKFQCPCIIRAEKQLWVEAMHLQRQWCVAGPSPAFPDWPLAHCKISS